MIADLSTLSVAAPVIPLGQPFQLMPQCHACPYKKFHAVMHEIAAGNVPPPVRTGITLRAAIDEVIAAKITAGLRPHSIHVMRHVLNQFARGREDMPLASIGVKEIEDWLAGLKIKSSTKLSNVTRLSSLFSYHVRRDNITANPCRKLERIKVEKTAPLILTPDQADTLLKNTPRKFRPYVILGMFAGIRPEETQKLTWEDICLETKTVRVNLAKTRRRRIVPLEPRAVALLEKCARKKGSIAPSHSTLVRFKHMAREALGFDRWPQDLLRHTAASYLLALIGDTGKVAARLGNSSAVLLTHYHQPVKQADCEKFWAVKLCPSAPRWTPLPERKYDYKAVRAFYDACLSYKKTREQFGITNNATLHYILHKQKTKMSALARGDGQAISNKIQPVGEMPCRYTPVDTDRQCGAK